MAWHLMYFNGIGVKSVPIEPEIPQVFTREARNRVMEMALCFYLSLKETLGNKLDEPILVWCETLKADFHFQASPGSLGIHTPDETAEYEYHGHEE